MIYNFTSNLYDIHVLYFSFQLMCKALRCDLGDWGMGVTNDVPPLDGTSCGKSNRDVSTETNEQI